MPEPEHDAVDLEAPEARREIDVLDCRTAHRIVRVESDAQVVTQRTLLQRHLLLPIPDVPVKWFLRWRG